ncbi:glucosyltransferase [Tulasnella sp. 330]|nr:glucosyltransferase [Tulasnella sp. 330]KAG8874060.1 glucosyltransferase [Tulasnella sp. 331]KAG8887126.1 glucosyltransferase [Tulasnella sp. 332]
MLPVFSTPRSLCLYAVWTAVNIATARLVNEKLPEVYMDEPFHITQAQAYCRGEWSRWDPKITTPPGLYALSVGLNQILRLACTIPNLRFTNLIFLQITPLLIALLLRSTRASSPKLPPHCTGVKQVWKLRPPSPPVSPPPPPEFATDDSSSDTLALVLSTFPVFWFFGFLYYTDVGSAVGVIATIFLAREGKHWLAAAMGVVSTFFRQTNIIWLGYAFLSFTTCAFKNANLLPVVRSYPHFLPLTWDEDKKKIIERPADQAMPADLILHFVIYLWEIPSLLTPFLPYGIALAGFISFVIWNGGIVLGDKSNHIPSTHFPQLFYFIAFATAFSWPALFSGIKYGAFGLVKEVMRKMVGTRRRVVATCSLLIIIEFFIWKYTMHHPFLLSDNRHYTFYFWRRVMMAHPFVPYLLGPIYLACGWTWWVRLAPTSPLIDLLIIPLFTIITLLPTPLLEPRYFIIPFLLLRIQLAKDPSRGEWVEWAEFCWYAFINAITVGVFLFGAREPTRGAEDLGIVRFMW